MIRRYTRLRREYLYRKSLEGKDRERYEKKRILKKALAEGRPIPNELRDEADELRKEIDMEDDSTKVLTQWKVGLSHLDDEYSRAGVEDPKVFITTARDPSSRLQQFAKELKLVFPNSQRMNRGNHVVGTIVETCRSKGVTDVIIVHEHRGEPNGLIVCHLPFGPTAYFTLSNCVMRHDIANSAPVSQGYPHLIFDNFSTKLGERTLTILKYLFPVPKEDSKRVVTFSNANDFVSFRHHVYEKRGREVVIKEVGPRFEMKLFQIKLGTLDQKEADVEWALRPYMNTSRKRKAL